MNPVSIEEDDQSEFAIEVLNKYLNYLQDNDQESCHELQSVNPKLKKIMTCLDSLERLAPDTENSARVAHSLGPEDPTHVLSSGTPKRPLSDQKIDFGNYELLEEIGRGGGWVWSIKHARKT